MHADIGNMSASKLRATLAFLANSPAGFQLTVKVKASGVFLEALRQGSERMDVAGISFNSYESLSCCCFCCLCSDS
jgi:hypothetical protein